MEKEPPSLVSSPSFWSGIGGTISSETVFLDLGYFIINLLLIYIENHHK